MIGAQSTAKSIFLLISMAGWLLIGGALIYAGPWFYHLYAHSETSTLWITNLEGAGYDPVPYLKISTVVLLMEVVAYGLWYSKFDQPHSKNQLK